MSRSELYVHWLLGAFTELLKDLKSRKNVLALPALLRTSS